MNRTIVKKSSLTTSLICCAFALLAASCASSGDDKGGGGGTTGGGSSSSSSSGGSSVSGGGDTVTFSNGSAVGSMDGYGWVALGELDTLTDPTCDTTKVAITKAAACTTSTNWNAADALCITGFIPAVVGANYTANWGVQIGVNVHEKENVAGTNLGKSYKTVAFTVEGTPSAGLRAMLHRKGDADDKTFCSPMQSGKVLTITSFNTACWDGSGDNMKEADVALVDKAGVQVSSLESGSITVTNLCLKKIEFGN